MGKRIIMFLLLLVMVSCNKTNEKQSKFEVGIKNLEENRYKEAEEAFLQVEKSSNKEVYIYLLRLYEKTESTDKIKEIFEIIKADKDLIFPVAYEYLFGSKYIKEDSKKARELLLILSKEKDMLANIALGYIYENGYGVDVNLKKSKFYYEKSEINQYLNNTIGSNFLSYIVGLKYELGIESPKDLNLAKENYKKAMDEGNRDAYTRLGYIQVFENKTERHLKNGFLYLEKALNMGDKNALLSLGEIYLKGISVPRDINKAKEYYQKGIDAKIKEAYGLLAHIELFNNESIVIDYKKIKELAQAGSKMSDGNSLKIMGYLYHNGFGVKKNERTAEKYYLKAIEEGELLDNLVYWYLGNLYFYGSKRVQNNAKALENYLIASEYYEASAYEVGIIYENGYGVDIDLEKAKEYYKRASNMVPKAEERLKALENTPVVEELESDEND